jgi:hypothetical protein
MTRLTAALLGIAGLAAVVALEVANAPQGTVEALPSRAVALPPSAAEASVDHSGEWAATILGRPLFSADRRPSSAASAIASVPGLPRLSGIMVGPFGRSAIFAADGPKPLVAQEGARIAGYTLKAIEPTQVRLTGPQGNVVLYPTFATVAAAPGRVTKAPSPR